MAQSNRWKPDSGASRATMPHICSDLMGNAMRSRQAGGIFGVVSVGS